jgi:predicted DNA binding protein
MLMATFQLDHEAIALSRAFERVPEMVIEAERIAAHSTEWTMPCLWASGTDFTSIDGAVSTDPSVERIVEETEFTEEKYYQIEWTDDVLDQITTYIDMGGSILSATATLDGWRLSIRFATRDQFDFFRETLSEQGYSYTLLELSEPDSPRLSSGGLTPRQREALITAMQHGYYRVPRKISSDELSEELGITHQTLSELLRRGTEKIIRSQLMTSR